METSYKALLDRAATDFPAVFGGKRPVPLAVGTFDVLTVAWPDVSRSRLYLIALTQGGPRFYLDGSVDGEVTEVDQGGAKQRLEVRQTRELEAFQATLDRLKRERRERLEAQYEKGIAEHKARRDATRRRWRNTTRPSRRTGRGKPRSGRRRYQSLASFTAPGSASRCAWRGFRCDRASARRAAHVGRCSTAARQGPRKTSSAGGASSSRKQAEVQAPYRRSRCLSKNAQMIPRLVAKYARDSSA